MECTMPSTFGETRLPRRTHSSTIKAIRPPSRAGKGMIWVMAMAMLINAASSSSGLMPGVGDLSGHLHDAHRPGRHERHGADNHADDAVLVQHQRLDSSH